MTERPHGYLRYVIDACRCNTCGWELNQYRARIAQAIEAGTWHPWTDPAPTMARLQQLKQEGIGSRTIAAATGLDRTNVVLIAAGRRTKIRPDTEEQILGLELTLEQLPDQLYIDATGTHRRLQALVRRGWPQKHLTAQTSGSVWHILHNPKVTAANARAIRDLYDRLWNRDPDIDPVLLARTIADATAKGWAPVGAWDDDTIDDPATTPDWTGCCGTTEGYWIHHNRNIRPVCKPCSRAAAADRAAAKAAPVAA